MALDPTFAKVIAIGILGGVAKNLFGPPPAPVTHVHNHPQPEANQPELTVVPQEDH